MSGNFRGEITLWKGLNRNFESIFQAHDYSIRHLMWKHDHEILVSCDSKGYLKYWTKEMKNLRTVRGHVEAINDMCFSPSYSKFATASGDKFVKIWDFASLTVEQQSSNHGWDVLCIDWHPFKSIVASGAKEKGIMLWCPRSGECIRSLRGHKGSVSCLKINQINGNWMMSGSMDQLVKIWDLRMLGRGEYDTVRCEIDQISSLSWHPHYERLFVAGGKSGDIKYFVVGNTSAKKSYQAEIHKAHEQIIWDFAWCVWM